MKLFVNKKHRRASITSTLIMIPVFMKFMPYGSFNPGEAGFWLSIICALFISISTNLAMVKFQTKKDSNN